jgi:hypothetical protein
VSFSKAVIAAALITTSLTTPLACAAEEPVQLGPRAVGETTSFRLEMTHTGTKESGHVQTTLALTSTPQGLHVASTAPAQEAAATTEAGGAVRVDGPLRTLLDPYNQVETALLARDGHGHSTVDVLAGTQEVSVSVDVTTTDSGGSTLVAFAGRTDTTVRGVNAHVAVDLHATIARGRLVSASARNAVDASVLLRKIHVEQVWSLTRLP